MRRYRGSVRGRQSETIPIYPISGGAQAGATRCRQDTGFLRSPPGNRLEALKGDRVGQYSIRVNDQFRVCFVWTDSGPANVEIGDYH